MTTDTEGIHEIANTNNADRLADVVFVHGLGGKSHATWRYGKPGHTDHFFWPEELGKELPHCGIWTVGYAAGITGLGNPGMAVKKRAGNLANQMTLSGIGIRPLIFITHSMGGLIVKQLIVSSQLLQDPARRQIAQRTCGIVFCGTPHRGSSFASAAGILSKVLGGAQAHVQEMKINADGLDQLHDEFLAWHRQRAIPIESYAESIGLFRKKLLGRAVPLGIVVPRASANPGIGSEPHDVDADHLTLVKPTPTTPAIHTVVFKGVLRFLKAALETQAAFSPHEESKQEPSASPPIRTTTGLQSEPEDEDSVDVSDEYANIVTQIEDVLNRCDVLTAFLQDAAPGLVQQQTEGCKLAAHARSQTLDLVPVLKGIANKLSRFSGSSSDWQNLADVCGGLVVLGIDRKWVIRQKEKACRDSVDFPADNESISVGTWRANLLHLVTCALGDGLARLEKVFGEPPLDENRVPEFPAVSKGITQPDLAHEVKLHFIRYIQGPEVKVDAADKRQVDILFRRTQDVITAAFHDDHNPYVATGEPYKRLTEIIRKDLQVQDLLLIHPSGTDDPELLLANNVRVLRFLGRIFDEVQAQTTL